MKCIAAHRDVQVAGGLQSSSNPTTQNKIIVVARMHGPTVSSCRGPASSSNALGRTSFDGGVQNYLSQLSKEVYFSGHNKQNRLEKIGKVQHLLSLIEAQGRTALVSLATTRFGENKDTILHLASSSKGEYGREVLIMLLELYQKYNLPVAPNKYKGTPVSTAAFYGNKNNFNRLISAGIPIGKQAIFSPIKYNHYRVLRKAYFFWCREVISKCAKSGHEAVKKEIIENINRTFRSYVISNIGNNDNKRCIEYLNRQLKNIDQTVSRLFAFYAEQCDSVFSVPLKEVSFGRSPPLEMKK